MPCRDKEMVGEVGFEPATFWSRTSSTNCSFCVFCAFRAKSAQNWPFFRRNQTDDLLATDDRTQYIAAVINAPTLRPAAANGIHFITRTAGTPRMITTRKNRLRGRVGRVVQSKHGRNNQDCYQDASRRCEAHNARPATSSAPYPAKPVTLLDQGRRTAITRNGGGGT